MKAFKRTTVADPKLPVAVNNQRWTSDITYINTDQGWLYLAVVMDLYSRAIVGWAMDKHMTVELVMAALNMALKNRRITTELTFHSDRGSQYCAGLYQQLLSGHGIACSMSGIGNCYDNAAMESFFHSLKTEWVHHYRYETRDAARNSIFEYIDVFYNRQRRHSYSSRMPPMMFEALAQVA